MGPTNASNVAVAESFFPYCFMGEVLLIPFGVIIGDDLLRFNNGGIVSAIV